MTGKRLLFVDPDPASTNYLEYEFKKIGYQVFSANTGKEGLIAAWRERPHVIILDPIFEDVPPAEFVEKLRKDPRTSHRKIMALSSLTQPDQIQAAIDIGFDRYLAKESDAIPALHETIQQLLQESPASQPAAPEDATILSASIPEDVKPQGDPDAGKVIVFLSAKGGTGTSSICANMAHAFHKRHPDAKIALFDMVLPIGSLASLVGFEEDLNIVSVSHLSSVEANPEYFLQNLPFIEQWGLHLLAGAYNPEQSNNIEISNIPIIINSLRQAFDYIFIDLGRSLSRISLPIITSANQVILILSLDEATVTLTLSVFEYLKQKGLRSHQVYPLINRAVGLEGLPKKAVDQMLGIEITGNIPHIGANFVMANNDRMPVPIRFPDNVVTIALREISEALEKRMASDDEYTLMFN